MIRHDIATEASPLSPAAKLAACRVSTGLSQSQNRVQDPDLALNTYHSRECAPECDEFFLDYLGDQAEHTDVVFDIETTEHISTHVTPISQMKVSVATALVVQSVDRSMLVFWGDPSTQRGAPLKFLR